MSTRLLQVRARIRPSSQPPFDRLLDPLAEEVLAATPFARERFATPWSEADALRRLGQKKLRPLAAPLARDLADLHRRLGASPASLAALDRMARGEAVAAVTGQQPGPLGGPLYSLHKIASAIGVAAEFTRRAGVPCVPVFWMHGEDSDFDEIRSATVADESLALHDLALPDALRRDGGLVGHLPLDPLRALDAEAASHWAGLPHAGAAASLLEAARAPAADLGEAYAALVLRVFAAQGIVIVDPRRPAFRAEARPILDRYLADAAGLAQAARAAGDRLEARGFRRALADVALDSFVFEIVDGTRRKLGVEEARGARDRVLSPSVVLRPAVQDGVLPSVAMTCGPGELAYLAQLREVFEGVGVDAASPVPRFGATWLPAAAVALLEESGADPWTLVSSADAVVRAHAETRIPPEPRAALERAQRAALDGLAAFSDAARALDPSLPQMVESARGKVDFQFQRLFEGLSGKVRHRLERQHPEWLRLRYFLLPGDKLQERRLASMEVVARRGTAAGDELAELATEHAARLADGVHEHHLLEL